MTGVKDTFSLLTPIPKKARGSKSPPAAFVVLNATSAPDVAAASILTICPFFSEETLANIKEKRVSFQKGGNLLSTSLAPTPGSPPSTSSSTHLLVGALFSLLFVSRFSALVINLVSSSTTTMA